jgi:hypothetical protein
MADISPYVIQAAQGAYGKTVDRIQEDRQKQLDAYVRMQQAAASAAASDPNLARTIQQNSSSVVAGDKGTWSRDAYGNPVYTPGMTQPTTDRTYKISQDWNNRMQGLYNLGLQNAPTAAQVPQEYRPAYHYQSLTPFGQTQLRTWDMSNNPDSPTKGLFDKNVELDQYGLPKPQTSGIFK